MSQFNKITLLGGTGFVGTQLAVDLAPHCENVTILTRRTQRYRDLKVLSNVHLEQCNVHQPDELAAAVAGSDAVVNLIGILNQSGDDGENSFNEAHVGVTENVVNAISQNGISRYLHMSSLGADAENGKSEYQRSKGLAEQYLQKNLGSGNSTGNCDVTVFRPSVIFGENDSFFNRFAGLVRALPVFPLACPDARMSPVYVEDVTCAMTAALGLQSATSAGAAYKLCATEESGGIRIVELCGPADYSLRELVEFTVETMGLKRPIIDLPDWAARAQGKVMGMLPAAPFSTDNYLSLQTDNVCSSEECRQATSIQSIVPRYIGSASMRDEQQKYRRFARR